MVTPEQARAELARRELARREAAGAPVEAVVEETTAVDSPVNEAIPAQEEQGLVSRGMDTLQLGLSDAMSTLAGDTYGRSGDPTEPDDLNYLSRAIKMVGGDILPAVGEVGGDAVIAAGKAVLPEAAEDFIADTAAEGMQAVAESDVGQAVGGGLDKWKAASPETYALAGELGNIGMAVAPVPKLNPKFGAKSTKKLKKALQDRKTLETERLLEPAPMDMRGKGELLEKGAMRTRVYEPFAPEKRKAKLVSEIADVDPRRSNNYNAGVMRKEITKLNDELVDSLDGLPEVQTVDIENAIDDAIDTARQTPNLAGEAGSQAEVLSNYVDRLISKYKTGDGGIEPRDLLKIRREMDEWTRKYGPKDLYGDKGSALSDANDAIREALNATVAKAAPDADVRQKLWDMSDLIAAEKQTYRRGLPGAEKGNRFSRYLANLERATGVKHPVNPQSIAISATNPQVGVGAALAALGIGAKKGAGAGLARNRTSAMNMMADAMREGSAGAQRAGLIDMMNEDDDVPEYLRRR